MLTLYKACPVPASIRYSAEPLGNGAGVGDGIGVGVGVGVSVGVGVGEGATATADGPWEKAEEMSGMASGINATSTTSAAATMMPWSEGRRNRRFSGGAAATPGIMAVVLPRVAPGLAASQE